MATTAKNMKIDDKNFMYTGVKVSDQKYTATNIARAVNQTKGIPMVYKMPQPQKLPANGLQSSLGERQMLIFPFSQTHDRDWRSLAYPAKVGGYEVLVIPKGTHLYSGCSVDINDDEVRHSNGTLDTALWYAFSSDFQYGVYGKVIVTIAKRDLYIMDMTKESNYKAMRSKYKIQTKEEYEITEEKRRQKAHQYDMNLANSGDSNEHQKQQQRQQETPPSPIPYSHYASDVFEYAFQSGKERWSHSDTDKKLSEWFSKNIINLDGWGLFSMPIRGNGKYQWHDEINISKPQDVLQRIPVEFRSEKDSVLLTVGGMVYQKFVREITSAAREFTPALSCGKLFKCVKWNIMDSYTPDKTKKSDRYLLLGFIYT
jgi:hypothetical protein